jgi:hypothetical protein
MLDIVARDENLTLVTLPLRLSSHSCPSMYNRFSAEKRKVSDMSLSDIDCCYLVGDARCKVAI